MKIKHKLFLGNLIQAFFIGCIFLFTYHSLATQKNEMEPSFWVSLLIGFIAGGMALLKSTKDSS